MQPKAIYFQVSFYVFLFFSQIAFAQVSTDSSDVISAEQLLFNNQGFFGVHLGMVFTNMRATNNLDNPHLLTPVGAAPEIGFNYMFYLHPHLALKMGITAGLFPVGFGSRAEAEAGQTFGNLLRVTHIEGFLNMPFELHYQHKLSHNTFGRVGLGGSVRTFSRGNSGYSISGSDANGQSVPVFEVRNIGFGQNNPDYLLKGLVGITRVMRNFQVFHLDLAYHFGFNKVMETNYQFFDRAGGINNEGTLFTNGNYLGLQFTYNLSRTNLFMHDQEYALGIKTDLRRHWQSRRAQKEAEKEIQRNVVNNLYKNPDAPSFQKLIKRPRLALHYQSFLTNTQSDTQMGTETFRTKLHHGFSLGLRYYQPLSFKWKLVTGLDYGEQYFYFEKELSAEAYQLRFDFWDYGQDFNSFINIPILIQHNSYLKNRWIWQNKTGLTIKKHFQSGFTTDGIYKSNAVNTDNESFPVFQIDYQFARKWFLNFQLSSGFQKIFRNATALSLDLVCNLTASNMMESPYLILPDSPQSSTGVIKAKNSFIGLSLEYLLPMKRALRNHQP